MYVLIIKDRKRSLLFNKCCLAGKMFGNPGFKGGT